MKRDAIVNEIKDLHAANVPLCTRDRPVVKWGAARVRGLIPTCSEYLPPT